uniref:BTB/POZ domain-containing protein n=1 Tax=Aegilops tauschii TaxID=37682 RepID=M8CG92_AEGTA
MKYMKLGSKPDTFYTEQAVRVYLWLGRSVVSDIPADLIIHVNNTKYQLHKFPLLLKCGLLQRLCSDTEADEQLPVPVALHDIPGGEEAFEICAKFCYGIAISISASNFVPAALAARVAWSYTYTRPGYAKRPHQSVPKDWWTEDISELDIEVFRSVVSTVRATRMLPSPLIGEALHVYACKHLPDPLYTGGSANGHASQSQSSSFTAAAAAAEEALAKQRRVLETVVTMIPGDVGSVTGRFLLRLLRVANYVGASSSTRAQLIRQAGSQLDEAKAVDLLIPLPSDPQAYDVGAAEAVLEYFLAQFQRPAAPDERRRMSVAMEKVVRIFDEYLKTIALDSEFPIGKFIDLAECLPGIARSDHDGLYRAVDTYLKEHPDLSKADRKRLCRLIDCRKLSPDERAQAVSNDRMPLRTIVQLLFVEQERTIGAGGSHSVARPDRASVDAVARLAATGREDEAAAMDHRSDVPRPRRAGHEERAQGEAAAMTRSLSASTKTAARKDRTGGERGGRLRDK